MYKFDKSTINLATNIVHNLKKHHLTIGTAESCTGGLVSTAISEISGSSEVFLGSIISYSNQVKQDILKVNNQTITEYGPVSRQCAIEMAHGLQNIIKPDIAISITGIAGPNTDNNKTQVGLVWIATSYKNTLIAKEHHFFGNRNNIRSQILNEVLHDIDALLSHNC